MGGSRGWLALIPRSTSSDQVLVKPWLSILVSATAALAASGGGPSWQPYVPADATALIGIQWSNLHDSALAPAIEAEIFNSGFPDIECLRQAREIVISLPGALAVVEGTFPAATVEAQAQAHGLRRSDYRGVTLWLPEQADKHGIAQIDDGIILVGSRKDIEAGIDGSLAGSAHQNSPANGDLWVATAKPSGALANLFGLTDASDLRAQANVRDGIDIEVSFDAGPDLMAGELASGFQEKPVVTVDGSRVNIALHADADELVTAWHAALAAAESDDPVKFQITHLENEKPLIVRIYYLEDGIHQMVLPPVPPGGDEALMQAGLPPIVKIFNLDGGPRGILLPDLP